MTTRAISVRDFSLAFALVAIWGFFSVMQPQFLGARNLSMLTIEMSTTAVAALGMLLIILLGHIDLSVGSSIGLTGGIAAVLIYKHGWNAPAAMGVAACAGVSLYALMGFLIARERIPAFIITLAGLLIYKGLFWKVIGNATIPVKAGDTENALSRLTTSYLPGWAGWALAAGITVLIAFSTWKSRRSRAAYGFALEDAEIAFGKVLVTGQILALAVAVLNQFRGVPLSMVVLGATAAAIWVVTQHTRFGRYLYACGGNPEAARISGVPVFRVTVTAFMVAGITATITGFMQTAYAGASTTTTGDLMELDAIAACVIGGTSLMGGRGTVVGVLTGAFLVTSLMNGMTLMAVTPEIKFIARGAVLALAVWMDVRLGRRGG